MGDRSYGTTFDRARLMEAAKANLNIQTVTAKSGIIMHHMQDPILERGNSIVHETKYEAEEQALKVVHATVIAVVPFVVFSASLWFTIWATGSQYPMEFLFVYFLSTSGLVFYITAMVRSQGAKQTKSKWRRWAGRLTQVAIFLGVVCGLYLYYTHFVFYNAYMNMNTYTNIAVSQPVDQFFDASMITFTTDTTLDVTRAVGFKSATANAMLCVAPIVDSSMSLEQEVHFFAIGVGCCEPRSSFHCDDAGDDSTRNALLLLEPSMLTLPMLEWTVAGAVDRSGFDAAIRMQTAAFATVTASKTRLVHWVKDPKALAKQYHNRGIEAVIIAVVIYFLASVFITWHHMFAPKWMSCE